MLLNWYTIDACFLSPAIRVRTSYIFFLCCFGAFFLAFTLEYLRMCQRDFDRYLGGRYAAIHDQEHPSAAGENLLSNGSGREKLRLKLRGRKAVAVALLEELLRALFYTIQLAQSYCVMLLVMYSNGKHHPTLCTKKTDHGETLAKSWRLHHHIHSPGSFCGLCSV